MKIEVQYLSDSKGKAKAVQLPLNEWEKILGKLKKYEQTLKIRSDLKEAYAQVDLLKKSKGEKITLSEFINEL
jgi:small nuclear ribonucleoprotein (snRNP)-like protein